MPRDSPPISFPSVRRTPFSRLTVAALFALSTFAVPGEALTHGAAHQHEREHDAHHAVADAHDNVSAVSAPEHGHDHQHPRLDTGAPTRLESLTIVIPVPTRVPAARVVGVAHVTPDRRATLARGDPRTGPPPRLRAPPAR